VVNSQLEQALLKIKVAKTLHYFEKYLFANSFKSLLNRLFHVS